jgi:uncharacterized protein YjiK
LPAALSPDGHEWHLAIHEAQPRKVVFFHPATLQIHGMADLPGKVENDLPDLSDSTVSARGTLLLLSDLGNAFAEFAFQLHGAHDWSLHSLHVTPIDTSHLDLGAADRLQPEGICFDDRENLWLACEGNTLLIPFLNQRR